MAKHANTKSWALYPHGDGSRRSYPGSTGAAAALVDSSGPVAAGGSLGSVSPGLVAPASGRTYETRTFFDMNYINNSAATAAGLALDTLGSGAITWPLDPAGGGNRVFQAKYNVNEDSVMATATIPASQSVYSQWSEYWDPLWDSADAGKANRFRSAEPSGVIIDHIYYGAAGNSTYGIVFQGADVDWFVDSPARSPACPKGAWLDMAMEEYLHPTAGYVKLYQKLAGGSWVMLPLKYNVYPHTSGYAQFPYFSGQTALNTSRRLTRIGFGGWLSLGSRNPGANARRSFRDCLILSTSNGMPT